MSDLLFRFGRQDGVCALRHPDEGELCPTIIEISAWGVTLDSPARFPRNEYLDINLRLDGEAPVALFAHVVDSGEQGLTLRWLHFDPGERQRLADLLDVFAANRGLSGQSSEDQQRRLAANEQRKSTRRITKPRPRATGALAPEAEPERRVTRRVTKPQTAPPSVPSDDDVDAFDELDISADDDTDDCRHRTSTIMPFADQTPQHGSMSLANDEDAPDAEAPVRKTRRIVRPKTDPATLTTNSPPPSIGRPKSSDEPDHVVVEQTGHFVRRTETNLQDDEQTPSSTTTARLNIVGDDGRLDVGATIRNRTQTVNAAELAARHNKVRVLNMSTIKALIQDAVEEAVQRMSSSLDEHERKRLLEEAESAFQERFRMLQAEKLGLEQQATMLKDQLARAQSLLEEERNKEISVDQFTVSEAGMEDLEHRFERLVNRAIDVNGVNDQLAEELRQMVNHLLDNEREHIAEQALEAQSSAIKLLEKKVSRLANTLESTEQERDRHMRRAKALETSSGGALANVMDAGLDEEDPEKGRKLELLKEVMEQNRKIRASLEESGVAVTSRRPQRPPPPPPPSEPEDDDDKDDDPAEDQPQQAQDEPETGADTSDIIDPDDMPWEIGMAIAPSDPLGDGDRAVPQVATYKDFAPPPLQRDAPAPEDTPQDVAIITDDSGDIADDDFTNPDDLPWEPDESQSDSPSGAVKTVADFKDFQPPPLRR